MAVQVSRSGGIYIEISGDYSKLQADLREAGVIGKAMGKEISDALSGALSPRDASRYANNLTKYLSTAQRAAQATTADLSSMDQQFREMGKAIGVAENSLEGFVKAQRQMYQTQSQKAFADNLKGIQRLTGASDAEMNKLAKSLGGVGNEFTKASEGIKVFGVNLGTAMLAGGVALAGKKIVDFGKESFDLAGRYETLGVVVRQVGQIAGYTAIQVDENVNALRRMGIAGVEARKTLTQLIQAQVNINKAPGLARIAQDAAVIGGTNSSEAFEKMVHGIQSAQTEVLRTIGINVNFEQSYAKLAAQLGKTTAELTEQERVQARVNAVTEAGEKIAGSYEAAMSTLGKQMSSLSRIQQDLATDFGKFMVDLANATGGVKGYTVVLEGWNASVLAMRGKMAGLSLDEMTDVSRSGGLQAFRELVEGMEEARDSTERFEMQLAAAASKLDEADTTFLRNQLATLKKQFDDGVISVDTYRRAVNELMVVLRAGLTAPAIDAPMTGDDLTGAKKALEDLRAAYSKTSSAMKDAKVAAIDANIAMVRSLNPDNADKMLKAFQAERDKLTKGTRSRSSDFAENRAVKYAEDAYKKAEDAAEQLRLKNEELAASLNGDTMAASLAKIEGQYRKQIAAIDKDTKDLMDKTAEWSKKGLLTPEVQGFVDQYTEQNRLLKEQIGLQLENNKALEARRALESTLGFSLDADKRLTEQMGLLKTAYDGGAISLEQYNIRLRNTGLELAKLHQEQGLSTWTEDAILALARITESYEGVAAGLTETFGDFFESFTQGFADSVGRAVVDSENLGEAMHNVAKSAISSLISGLVQLGIQWAMMQMGMTTASVAAQQTVAATSTATNAEVLASAAPAAAAQSVASWGTAAVVGAAALAAAMGLMIGVMMKGFKTGGYTGNAGKDEVTGVVHGGEYVFNADSVRRIGLSQLEALQRGSVGARSSSGKAPASSSSSALQSAQLEDRLLRIIIEDKATGEVKDLGYVTRDEAITIARDEAREVTREYAPKVIASNIGNPNSAVSKSLGKNTKAERRR